MPSPRAILPAKPREGAGKGPSRRLRAQGLIPAVVYGRHSKTPRHIAVDPLAIKHAVATPAKLNTLIQIKLDGDGAGETLVLLKDVQVDPVTRDMLHADFLEVREGEKVKVNVPLHLVGKPAGVLEGGILSQLRRELEVWTLPTAIPDQIEVDVSHLKMAQALHINDVKPPAGIEIKTHVNYTIAVVSAPEKEEVVVAPVVAAVPGAPVLGPDGKPLPVDPAAAAAAGKPGADGKPAPGAAPGGKAAPAAAAGKKEDKKK